MAYLTPEQYLDLFYVGYFGRAADASGRAYWIKQMDKGESPAAVALDFSHQQETLDTYPDLGDGTIDDAASLVTQIYHNLFNREPDAGGLAYWVAQLTDPHGGLADVVLRMIDSAGEADQATLQNKAAVSAAYAAAQAIVPEHEGSSGEAHDIVSGVSSTTLSRSIALEHLHDLFEVTVTVVKDHTVYVDKPVPYPVYVPTEPTHVVHFNDNGALDISGTHNYAGLESNFGDGNHVDQMVMAVDETSGVELALGAHYRQGPQLARADDGDNDGMVRVFGDSGSQDGSHADRSAVSFDFSVNEGVGVIENGRVEYHLLIDTDPGAGVTSFLDLHLLSNGPGDNVWVDPSGAVLVDDDDGTNPHISQNSVNFGFDGIADLIVGGHGAGGTGDLPAGEYTISLEEHVDGVKVMGVSEVFVLTDPTPAP